MNKITRSLSLQRVVPTPPPVIKLSDIDTDSIKQAINKAISSKEKWVEGLNKNGVIEKRNKMSAFIQGDKFDHFFSDLLEVMNGITEKDLKSLEEMGIKFNQSEPTPNIKKFLKCMDQLREAGFHSSEGKRITLWSGKKGKEKALNSKGYSEGQIPAIYLLFKIYGKFRDCILHKNVDIRFLERFGKLISLAFVMHASQEVDIYISSDKKSEPSSLKQGNYLWNIELYYLQLLRFENLVTKINLYLLKNDKWVKYDINNPEHGSAIPVIRRNAYRSENPAKDENPERFDRNLRGSALEVWQETSSPRKKISFERLRYYGRKFIQRIRDKKHSGITHPFGFESDSILFSRSHAVRKSSTLFASFLSNVDFDEKSKEKDVEEDMEQFPSFARRSSLMTNPSSISDEEVGLLNQRVSGISFSASPSLSPSPLLLRDISSSSPSPSPSAMLRDSVSPSPTGLERIGSSSSLSEENSEINGLHSPSSLVRNVSSSSSKARRERKKKALEKEHERINKALSPTFSSSSSSASSTPKRKARGLGAAVLTPKSKNS